MKKYLLLFLLLLPLSSSYSILNAVGDEKIDSETQTQSYNPSDYDPGIPQEWIRPDGTFGE